jgi:hypothetical protein
MLTHIAKWVISARYRCQQIPIDRPPADKAPERASSYDKVGHISPIILSAAQFHIVFSMSIHFNTACYIAFSHTFYIDLNSPRPWHLLYIDGSMV